MSGYYEDDGCMIVPDPRSYWRVVNHCPAMPDGLSVGGEVCITSVDVRDDAVMVWAFPTRPLGNSFCLTDGDWFDSMEFSRRAVLPSSPVVAAVRERRERARRLEQARLREVGNGS